MKNLKNPKSILFIVGFVVLAAVLVFIIIRTKNINQNSGTDKNLENIPAGEAKAQVYSSPKSPSIKDVDNIIGPKESPLTVFVYEDNSNIYSAKLADTLNKIYSENQNKFNIVVRPFIPKGSALSEGAALAIECAAEQNKWIEMRAFLFAKTKDANINLSEMGTYAKQLSLDETKFNTCLTNNEKSLKIEGLSAEASSYGIIGAPTIFINNEMIIGARPYNDYVDSNGDKIEGLNRVITSKLQ